MSDTNPFELLQQTQDRAAAVVSGITWIIVLDGIFAVVTNVLEI